MPFPIVPGQIEFNQADVSPEPTDIVAGDTLSWQRAFGDFPASVGWTLSYVLNSPTARFVVQSGDITADGNGFDVLIPASETKNWTPGTYQWLAIMQLAAASVSTSATTTNGSPAVNVTSAAGITVGAAVAGTGIPGGTTVLLIVGTTITLSANATATGTATLTFTTPAQRRTVALGRINIGIDLLDATTPQDTRSANEIALSNIDAMLAGVASSGVEEYTINGRMLRRYSLAELRGLRSDYAARVRQERADRGEYERPRTVAVHF